MRNAVRNDLVLIFVHIYRTKYVQIMNKKLIRFTENNLNKIINETTRKILNEVYHSKLYHYTTLPLLYCILTQNNLIADHTDEFWDYRKGTYNQQNGKRYNCICFTRDKTYNIRSGYGVNCRLVFDADKLMQLRHAKLYPVNWSKQAKVGKNNNEAEERLWGVNVTPLNEYVERIDIIISDLSTYSDGSNDLDDELYEMYYDSYFNEHPNSNDTEFYAFLGEKLINKIMALPKFKGKINLVYQ